MIKKNETILSNKIKNNGWIQGSLFLSSPKKLGIGNSNKEILYLLVTHSCNIVHIPFKDEPFAEIIPAIEIANSDGNLTYGKNPRKLHVKICNNGKDTWYELAIINIAKFPKEKLSKFKPSTKYIIYDHNLRIFINWLGGKYNRATFPDSFNDRLSKINFGKKITDLLKKGGKEIWGIYIRLNSNKELSPEQEYKVMLHIVISDNAKPIINDLNFTLKKFVEIIEKGINIKILPNCALLTLDEFTARDIITMQRWDNFDYLSNK